MEIVLQSGFDVDGEAMTTPDPAPEEWQPEDPMLQRSCSRAIGSSVAMKVSTDLFRSARSRRARELPGRPRIV